MGVAGVDCSSKTQKAPGAASVNALKQHRDLHFESPGNLLNALERQVALAAFHLAEIGPVLSAGLEESMRFFGVGSGGRTHDIQSHSLAFCH